MCNQIHGIPKGANRLRKLSKCKELVALPTKILLF
jgi:hypothetical protein